MEKNLFEMACRHKFRFPYKGQISTEELWDLSATQLDSIFKSLNAQAKKSQEESLLATKSSEDSILDAKIEIVRYVFLEKQAAAEATKQMQMARAQKQKILSVLADKEDQELKDKSINELRAMLNNLE